MTNLMITSDGTAAGTLVLVKGEELEGVRRIEILIGADGNSSVAIETDEDYSGSEVAPEGCDCCYCQEEAVTEEVNERIARIDSSFAPVEAQLKALVNSQSVKALSGGPTVSKEEAKAILRKLLDPKLVDAAEAVFVIDTRF